MERFNTSLKDKELSRLSTISLEVNCQGNRVNRVKLYPIMYPKKETNPVKSWFSVTSTGFKPVTS